MSLLDQLQTSSSSSHIILPLVEKYRPTSYQEILCDPFLQSKIKNILKSDQLPNMVITGEPSTGKTSTALYMSKQIYKKDYENNVLELNASYDRGLSMIQTTILPFCKKKSNNYKLIILDEADSITQKAQSVLNNIITDYKNTVRFIFICNEGFKINESIQSRCMLIHFSKISKKNIKKRLKEICEKEEIKYDTDGLNRLMFCSNYDIRQCINNIECIKYTNSILNENTIDNIIDIPKLFHIRAILKSCITNNLKEALMLVSQLYDAGFSANDILLTFLKYIEHYKDYKEFEETTIEIEELYKIISNSYIKVNNGIDSFLQVCGCINKMYLLLNT